MKYLLAGDFHGRSLEELRNLDFDVLLCTGDFDRPDVVKEFIELKDDLESEDKDVYTVPGNHDNAVLKGQNISSGTLRQQGNTIPELHKELQNRPEEREFLEQILDQRRRELMINGRNTILVHGALAGDLMSYPDCPPDERIFWRRLQSKEDHEENFNEMASQGYSLMVRGHDHVPEYTCRYDNSIEVLKPDTSTKYVLGDDRFHTITTGSWFNGWYATIEIDSSDSILRYHNMER